MRSVVRVHPGPPLLGVLKYGGLAQLGERLPCTQEVSGSIPLSSTIFKYGGLSIVEVGQFIDVSDLRIANLCHLTDVLFFTIWILFIDL